MNNDTSTSRFASLEAETLYYDLIDGVPADAEAGDGSGEFLAAYGATVLVGDAAGFVSTVDFATAEAASRAVNLLGAEWDQAEIEAHIG